MNPVSHEKPGATRAGLLVDWPVNRRNAKGQLILVAYRCCRAIWTSNRFGRLLGIPVLALYRVGVEWILGVELGWRVEVGPRLRLYHGVGLVVHPSAVIGADCTLRHSTTLGTKHPGGEAPRLGDSVDVGCGSVILGGVRLGDRSVVGAGSVVIADVAADTVVAGNPARVIAGRPESGA
jgi:serine acetyltransferase